MTTGYITHPDFLKHEMGSHHPECPERIQAINDQMIRSGIDHFLHHLDAPLASEDQLELVHSPDHIAFVKEQAPQSGYAMLDGDTIMNPHTWQASLRAAGAAIAGVDAVMKGEVENVFCAVRPPGHHAEPTRSMGFCLFDNVAIAARYAMETYGIERVAIIDFDVHHGNGTQEIFWHDSSVLYASTHEMPLYPGTGATRETGEHNSIVNAPLRAGDGSAQFREAMQSVILPRLSAMRPDLILISAGFDAGQDDLGNSRLDTCVLVR